MDERQLAELFHEAAGDAPNATFDHADVVAASRRVTARRRMAVAGGSAIGIAVLVGGIVIGSGFFSPSGSQIGSATGGSGEAQSRQAPPALDSDNQSQRQQPEAASPLSEADGNGPEATAEQGRTASGKVVPWPGLRNDGARAGCGPVDRELADALISEFPATTAAQARPVPDGCPPDAKAAAIPVSGGWLYVVLGPVAGDGPPDQFVARDDGSVGFSFYTPKGSVLLVLSVPDAGASPPFIDRLQPLAEKIGSRY